VPEAEEELAVHVLRVLAGEVDDHGCDVVGIELLDLRHASILALDALLLPELARAAHLLVDRHARARHRGDRVDGDAVLAEVARRHLGEATDGGLGGPVARLPGSAEQTRPRAEGDDPPVAADAPAAAGGSPAREAGLPQH